MAATTGPSAHEGEENVHPKRAQIYADNDPLLSLTVVQSVLSAQAWFAGSGLESSNVHLVPSPIPTQSVVAYWAHVPLEPLTIA